MVGGGEVDVVRCLKVDDVVVAVNVGWDVDTVVVTVGRDVDTVVVTVGRDVDTVVVLCWS